MSFKRKCSACGKRFNKKDLIRKYWLNRPNRYLCKRCWKIWNGFVDEVDYILAYGMTKEEYDKKYPTIQTRFEPESEEYKNFRGIF